MERHCKIILFCSSCSSLIFNLVSNRYGVLWQCLLTFFEAVHFIAFSLILCARMQGNFISLLSPHYFFFILNFKLFLMKLLQLQHLQDILQFCCACACYMNNDKDFENNVFVTLICYAVTVQFIAHYNMLLLVKGKRIYHPLINPIFTSGYVITFHPNPIKRSTY